MDGMGDVGGSSLLGQDELLLLLLVLLPLLLR